MDDDATPAPGDEGSPFGLPFLDDLVQLLSAQSGRSWDTARQMAITLAGGGASEPNVDPLERLRIEELTRIAELHVSGALGLTPAPTVRQPTVTPVTRTEWAARTLDAYRPIFDRLSSSLGRQDLADETDLGDLSDPSAAMLAQMMQLIAPQMLGMAIGSMVGHLAASSLGGYDLPIPRPATDQLLVIPANLRATAETAAVDVDDLQLWVLLNELTHHAVFGVGPVRAEIERLILDHASGYHPDARALQDRLADVDISDPSSMAGIQQVFGDPEVLLGAVRSDIQRGLLPHLEAIAAVVTGVVDHVLDTAGAALLGGDHRRIAEVWTSRRSEPDKADRMMERLLGVELRTDLIDRGDGFVSGVLERAGEEGLARLWETEENLPTPAEVDAPGLWLARIDLPR